MKLAFFLTLIILVVELIGGFISHSLALLSDAGHVLTDIACSHRAIVVCYAPSPKASFGKFHLQVSPFRDTSCFY
ncbi:cation transporter [Priestia sp. 179-F W1.4 NHS]